MSTKWFVCVGEEEMGPLGPGGLRKLAQAGEIDSASLLRREDRERPVRADQVPGLLPSGVPPGAPPRSEPGEPAASRHWTRPQKVYGPYASPRILALALQGLLGASAVVAVFAIVAALGGRDPTTARTIGLCVLLVTAVGFVLWLRRCRINLPHLIFARVKYAPGWTIACWFVPVVNLMRPYQVVSEVDRLTAEAAAGGDASVKARRCCLVPWWVSAVLAVGLGIAALATSGSLAVGFAVAAWLLVAAASVFATLLVRRITGDQERARSEHDEPVQLHHELGRKQKNNPRARLA